MAPQWTREQLTIVIDIYNKSPCLYDVKSKYYHNKHARNAALDKIQEELNKIGMTVTHKEIKDKFGNLRSHFLALKRKHNDLLKNGAGTEEFVKPSLWYYDKMQFLTKHHKPLETTNSLIQKQQKVSQDENMQRENFYSTLKFEDDDIEDGIASQNKVDEVLNSAVETLQQLPNTFSEIRNKSDVKSSVNTVFSEYVRINLDIIEKADMNLYIDVQEQMTNIIFAARRKINEIHS